jgi:hypothetical protein
VLAEGDPAAVIQASVVWWLDLGAPLSWILAYYMFSRLIIAAGLTLIFPEFVITTSMGAIVGLPWIAAWFCAALAAYKWVRYWSSAVTGLAGTIIIVVAGRLWLWL